MADIRKSGGWAGIAGAALAIAGNVALLVTSPTVPAERLSYPLSSQAFQLMQVFFALTQALMAYGIAGLAWSDAARPGRGKRVFGWLAIVGMAVTVPGELVLIFVADANADADSVSAASTLFGLGVLLADAGLIGLGILAARQRLWPTASRFLPIALGLFQLLVVTPVSISAGFTSVISFVVIAIADLMTAGISMALLRNTVSTPQSRAQELTPA